MQPDDPYSQFEAPPAGGRSADSPQTDTKADPYAQFETTTHPMGARKRAAMETAAVADLVLGIPAMAASVMADTAERLSTSHPGRSRKEAAIAGKKAGEEFSAPLQAPLERFLEYISKSEDPEHEEPTSVNKVMGKITEYISKVGAGAEKLSGGAILQEDVELLTNAFMTDAGIKATRATLKTLKGERAAGSRPPPPHPDPKAMGDSLKRDAEAKATIYVDSSGNASTELASRLREDPKDLEAHRIAQQMKLHEEAVEPKGDPQGDLFDDEGKQQELPLEPPKPSEVGAQQRERFEPEKGKDEWKAGPPPTPPTPPTPEQAAVKRIIDRITSPGGRYTLGAAAVAGAAFSQSDPDTRNSLLLLGAVIPFGKGELSKHLESLPLDKLKEMNRAVNDSYTKKEISHEQWKEHSKPIAAAMKRVSDRPKDAEGKPAERRTTVRTPEHEARYAEKLAEKTEDPAEKRRFLALARQLRGDVTTDRATIFGRESGKADPVFLARLAAVGIGAAVAANLADKDDKFAASILGAAAGLIAPHLIPKTAIESFRKLAGPDTRIRVNHLGDDHDAMLSRGAAAIWSVQDGINRLAPKKASREKISHWIEGDKSIQLTPNEMKAAQLAQAFMSGMKTLGLGAGVLKDAVDNYVTHIWEHGVQTKNIVERALGRVGRSMSPETPYAKRRSFDTIKEGKEAGLKPRTEDIMEIIGIYGHSIVKAIANKKLIDTLKGPSETPDKTPLVMPMGKAPQGYQPINHPALAGMLMHPDIVSSMKVMFDSYTPGVIMAALQALGTGIKKIAVSLGLFHVKSMAEAGMLAAAHPFTALKVVAQSAFPKIFGENQYIKQVRLNGGSDLVDWAAASGVKFNLGPGALSVAEMDAGLYQALGAIQSTLDKIPLVGKLASLPVEAITKLNQKLDAFTWARVHAGLKLTLFADRAQLLLENSAKAAERNEGKTKPLTKEQAGKIAADFVNGMFGGLNWRMMAEAVKSKMGRDIALSLVSEESRAWQRLALFAPDWLVSTMRPLIKSWGEGSGLRGIIEPKTLADLNRQYLVRAAVYYAILGNGINMATSGHFIWDNKDPTRIDLGDGRSLGFAKHTMEPVHALTDPKGFAINKMGLLPREAAEQGLGVEYLSSKGKMPPMEGSGVAHAARNFSPISAHQGMESGPVAGMSGALGFPIYGKDAEQKRQAQAARRDEKLKRESENRQDAIRKRIDKILENQ